MRASAGPFAQDQKQTRPGDEKRGPGEVAHGEFLACFFRDREIFHRHGPSRSAGLSPRPGSPFFGICCPEYGAVLHERGKGYVRMTPGIQGGRRRLATCRATGY